MHVHLTISSRNAKTGPIPVSTTSAASCPNACPFNNANKGGCYAESGPLAMHWRKVTQGVRGDAFGTFLDKIARLPKGQLWRHNAAGDLMGKGDTLDVKALAALVKANRGRKGFTYTHKPLVSQAERDAIRDANASGFTVNLSGNDLAHADSLYDMDIGPVVVVLPKDTTQSVVTPKGRKVIVCPATVRDDVSCATCGICAKLRKAIIGFPAHGTSVKKANAIALGAN
jgi:hypothetical protein